MLELHERCQRSCVCAYACIPACLRVCLSVFACVQVRAPVFVYVPVCVHTNCTCMCMRVCELVFFILHLSIFYSAFHGMSLSEALPTTQQLTLCRSLHAKRYRQLQEKDLPKVLYVAVREELEPASLGSKGIDATIMCLHGMVGACVRFVSIWVHNCL